MRQGKVRCDLNIQYAFNTSTTSPSTDLQAMAVPGQYAGKGRLNTPVLLTEVAAGQAERSQRDLLQKDLAQIIQAQDPLHCNLDP